jgi:hypothetical protein
MGRECHSGIEPRGNGWGVSRGWTAAIRSGRDRPRDACRAWGRTVSSPRWPRRQRRAACRVWGRDARDRDGGVVGIPHWVLWGAARVWVAVDWRDWARGRGRDDFFAANVCNQEIARVDWACRVGFVPIPIFENWLRVGFEPIMLKLESQRSPGPSSRGLFGADQRGEAGS